MNLTAEKHFSRHFPWAVLHRVFGYLYGWNDRNGGTHAIREQDFDCRLIFLTQSEEYLREGYSVNAVHYLIKPVSDPDFTQAMRFCRLTSSPPPVYLDVVSSGTPIHLDTSNIVYINLQKRIVHIHTLKHTLPVTGTFTRVTEPLLSDPRFLLCIQGVLVNMDMIVDQPGSTFLMKNGDAVQINLRKKRSIVQAYRQYIFESMSETNEKDIKNRWKYRLGKLMGVMLAATTLGGSIDAKTLADFQTETYAETSEFKMK